MLNKCANLHLVRCLGTADLDKGEMEIENSFGATSEMYRPAQSCVITYD